MSSFAINLLTSVSKGKNITQDHVNLLQNVSCHDNDLLNQGHLILAYLKCLMYCVNPANHCDDEVTEAVLIVLHNINMVKVRTNRVQFYIQHQHSQCQKPIRYSFTYNKNKVTAIQEQFYIHHSHENNQSGTFLRTI